MPTKNVCYCPAYSFPHNRGGGKCNLPGSCDLMEEYECPTADCHCEYQDDCPLMDRIRHERSNQDHPSLTAQERNPDFRSW